MRTQYRKRRAATARSVSRKRRSPSPSPTNALARTLSQVSILPKPCSQESLSGDEYNKTYAKHNLFGPPSSEANPNDIWCDFNGIHYENCSGTLPLRWRSQINDTIKYYEWMRTQITTAMKRITVAFDGMDLYGYQPTLHINPNNFYVSILFDWLIVANPGCSQTWQVPSFTNEKNPHITLMTNDKHFFNNNMGYIEQLEECLKKHGQGKYMRIATWKSVEDATQVFFPGKELSENVSAFCKLHPRIVKEIIPTLDQGKRSEYHISL